jgi:hypothetical protein
MTDTFITVDNVSKKFCAASSVPSGFLHYAG